MVTLDGAPLENGTIEFFPTGAGSSAGTGITNGHYTVETSVGEMKVSINATKVVGKHKMYDTPDSPTVDKVADILPPKYNRTTELRTTLNPGANANVNFELKSH
jgi:hypothetical protein